MSPSFYSLHNNRLSSRISSFDSICSHVGPSCLLRATPSVSVEQQREWNKQNTDDSVRYNLWLQSSARSCSSFRCSSSRFSHPIYSPLKDALSSISSLRETRPPLRSVLIRVNYIKFMPSGSVNNKKNLLSVQNLKGLGKVMWINREVGFYRLEFIKARGATRKWMVNQQWNEINKITVELGES